MIQLRSIWHDEGRVTFDNSKNPTYQYFINDHQGSTRVVFQALNGTTYIAQQIDYGVTGDIISENSGQNLLTHLYQGKDWQDGFGFDFVTRTYDPYTMRMLQVDGANQFASGYTGMGNNPVSGIDPDGQVVFAIPQIGWSKKGGLSLGLEIGVGIPGALSASITGGYNFGSKKGYWSAHGYASGFYGGYGSQGGFAGFGYRYAGLSAGISYGKSGWGAGVNFSAGDGYNSAGIGFGWSQSEGWDMNVSASSAFLFGSTNSFMSSSTENTISGNTPVDFSAQSVVNIYNDNFADLNTNLSFYSIDKPLLSKDGIARTKTTFRGQKAISHKMYFSRSAFTSREQLAFSLVHELGHVLINSKGENSFLLGQQSGGGIFDTEAHVAIHKMTFQAMKTNGWKNLNGQIYNFTGTGNNPYLNSIVEPLGSRLIKYRK